MRGVDCDGPIRTLLARELIEEVGRAPVIGRPTLFGTTVRFLEYFGLERPDDLPPLPVAEEPIEDGEEGDDLNVGALRFSCASRTAHHSRTSARWCAASCSAFRNKFEVSVAEVADNDDRQRATIGVAVVSNDARHCEEVLREILEHGAVRRDSTRKSSTSTAKSYPTATARPGDSLP